MYNLDTLNWHVICVLYTKFVGHNRAVAQKGPQRVTVATEAVGTL